MLRMLLDTCATVAQAKEALLMTKQYYYAVPVHYLIADRHGEAFVWECSQTPLDFLLKSRQLFVYCEHDSSIRAWDMSEWRETAHGSAQLLSWSI